MVLTSWLNFFRLARRQPVRQALAGHAGCPAASESSRLETLEERTLLSAVAFDSLSGQLSFFGETDTDDDVEFTSLDAQTLLIRVAGGDAISLQDDAYNNPGFVISSTNTPNDTLTVDSSLINSNVQAVHVDLGNGTNQITAGSLTIGKLTVQNAGTAILDQVTVGAGGLNVQAQTIHVNGSVSATDVTGGDIVLSTGMAGTITIDTPLGGHLSSVAGDVKITTDIISITDVSSINAFQAVEILPADAARHIALGSPVDTTAGFLELSAGELNTISADVLRLGSLAGQGNIFITAAIDLNPAQVDTLSLLTAGGVANTSFGTLSVSNLRVHGNEGIFLDQNQTAYPQVNQVALSGSSDSISFITQGDLIVGTVDGASGIQGSDAGIVIASWEGSLTVAETVADHDIDSGNGSVTLAAFGAQGVTVQTGANVRGLLGIQVIGNQQHLDGNLLASGGIVYLTPAGTSSVDIPFGPPILIDLGGADSSTQLGISDAELDRITAATILIGDAGDYNLPNINVTGVVSPQYATTLLLTGTSVNQQGGLLQVAKLALRTLTGAGSGTPLATQVSQLAFYNQTSGEVSIDNIGALSLTAVDDLTQSSNLAGGVNLTTHSPLTIATSMLAGGDITLTAAESIDATDNLTINPGVTIISTSGSIEARAGDTLTQSGTLTVQVSAATITLGGGDNDLDGFGAVTLNGDLNTFDSSPQIWGGSGVDTITINRADGTVIGGGIVGLNLDAGTGNDQYHLNFNAGPFTRDIAIDDASGILDAFHMQATESDDNVVYDTTLVMSQITIGSRTIYFTGLETADIDGRDAQQDVLQIIENEPGFNPPGPGSITTSVPLTYGNFENVSITNSIPTVSNLSVTDSDEAGTATLTGDFSDAELHVGQTFILHIDWGDGTPVQDVPVAYTSATQSFSVDHSYADDNPTATSQDSKTVSVTVTDDNGGHSAPATTTALVRNVNPTLNVLTFSTSANEAGTALLQGTYADDGLSDTHVLIIDWDDGTPLETVTVSGGTFSVTHIYQDDTPTGTGLDLRHPTLTIQDDDGGTATSQPQILVKNVAPRIDSLDITAPVFEGATATLSGTYSDPGTLDTHHILIDWGDGSSVQTVNISGGTFSVTHVYSNQPTPGSASGTVSIGVTLRDDDGGQDYQTVLATVTNANPVVTNLDLTPAIEEHDTATLTGTYTDAGINDTHTLDIDWGDGSAIQTINVSGGTFSVTHQYLDDDPTDTAYDNVVVTVTLHDGDTGATTAATWLTIYDVPPVLSNIQISQSTAIEGDTITVTGDYTDVGTLDTHTLRVNWSDGGLIEIFQVSGGHFSVTHHYVDDNPPGTTTDLMSVGLALYDDDKGFTTASTKVFVNNVSPSATIDGAPTNSPEGTAIDLTATVTDIGTRDTFTYAWSVTKNGGPHATGTNPTFSFTPDDDGIYIVTLTVTDDDGGSTTTQKTIQATNVAPTAAIAGPAIFVLGQPTTVAIQATDPGAADQSNLWTYQIDWENDGTNDQTVIGGDQLQLAHAFDQLGPQTIRVTVTDKDDQTSEPQTLTVNVVQVREQSGILSVGGTTGNDRIRVKDLFQGQVEVLLNGTSLGTFVPTVVIQIHGSAGNDNILVDGTITIPCELHGQDGHDTLLGGGGDDLLDGGAGRDTLRGRNGNDILSGGDGNDFLSSGRGTDILIGGLGKDDLYGYQGGDLLIGGSTSHDGNQAELAAIRNEWTSGRTLDARVANLKAGVGTNGDIALTPNVDVMDDGSPDMLYGERGFNWFLSYVTDRVFGRRNPKNRVN